MHSMENGSAQHSAHQHTHCVRLKMDFCPLARGQLPALFVCELPKLSSILCTRQSAPRPPPTDASFVVAMDVSVWCVFDVQRACTKKRPPIPIPPENHSETNKRPLLSHSYPPKKETHRRQHLSHSKGVVTALQYSTSTYSVFSTGRREHRQSFNAMNVAAASHKHTLTTQTLSFRYKISFRITELMLCYINQPAAAASVARLKLYFIAPSSFGPTRIQFSVSKRWIRREQMTKKRRERRRNENGKWRK